MMKKTPQLSFTVLTIFIILVLGMMANANKKENELFCNVQDHHFVKKNESCVDSECKKKCHETHGPKAEFICKRYRHLFGIETCSCGIRCPRPGPPRPPG
ncbi:hypothetical protein BRARA_F01376 [Brassica rapa]|uniref:BnaA06g13660D protein n=2 Tax=Brassica TaxID=3705 RepID=A0A078K1X9_BRANA|nr:hypothetical protein BRARA_F01376 [Brassica rapa]CDY29430.1 BnaA06g13660D [Brassica napus]CDY71927.1 BnaA06g38520D [Brassica napus]